jgi:lipid A disaccharide synthetase
LLLRTPFRLLPNIIAEREIVPEFVPYIGGPGPIIKQANYYLLDSKHAAIQAEELGRICHRFVGKRPAHEAAKHIIKICKDGTLD